MWIGIFITILGLLLLYAGVKNQSPVTIIRQALGAK